MRLTVAYQPDPSVEEERELLETTRLLIQFAYKDMVPRDFKTALLALSELHMTSADIAVIMETPYSNIYEDRLKVHGRVCPVHFVYCPNDGSCSLRRTSPVSPDEWTRPKVELIKERLKTIEIEMDKGNLEYLERIVATARECGKKLLFLNWKAKIGSPVDLMRRSLTGYAAAADNRNRDWLMIDQAIDMAAEKAGSKRTAAMHDTVPLSIGGIRLPRRLGCKWF